MGKRVDVTTDGAKESDVCYASDGICERDASIRLDGRVMGRKLITFPLDFESRRGQSSIPGAHSPIRSNPASNASVAIGM